MKNTKKVARGRNTESFSTSFGILVDDWLLFDRWTKQSITITRLTFMINTDSLHICMFVQLIGVTGAKAKRRGLADWFSLDESEI